MDPIRNPYAPGAGARPPELAGRDEIREKARIGLERARIGRSSKGLLMVGLRGVGKTVLLDRIREDAEATGIYSLRLEASEKSLSAIYSGSAIAYCLVKTLQSRGREATSATCVAGVGRIRRSVKGKVSGY